MLFDTQKCDIMVQSHRFPTNIKREPGIISVVSLWKFDRREAFALDRRLYLTGEVTDSETKAALIFGMVRKDGLIHEGDSPCRFSMGFVTRFPYSISRDLHSLADWCIRHRP